jgi:hypothetical protein
MGNSETEDVYLMIDRWLNSKPAEDERALTIKEASAEAIMKAAALSKQSAFSKLNRRFHRIMDKLTAKTLTDNIVKEIEVLKAVRQEAEQLFGPLAREERQEAAPNVNFQLAFLTHMPSQLTEVSVQAIEVKTEKEKPIIDIS